MQGARVRSLVGELKSCMPHGGGWGGNKKSKKQTKNPPKNQKTENSQSLENSTEKIHFLKYFILTVTGWHEIF